MSREGVKDVGVVVLCVEIWQVILKGHNSCHFGMSLRALNSAKFTTPLGHFNAPTRLEHNVQNCMRREAKVGGF